MTSKMLQTAIEYLNAGLSVMPIKPGAEKRPHIKWAAFQNRRATEKEVRKWFSQWPDANLGIITGEISGLVVLDCDSQEAVEKALQYGVNTPYAKTGNGAHFYFQHPGYAVKNFVKQNGFDLRGDGGYVVAPPSVHHTKRVYTWVQSPNECDFAPLPAWLVALSKMSVIDFDSANGIEDSEPDEFNRFLVYNLIAQIEKAEVGTRNDTAHKNAFTLGGMVAAERADESEIRERVHEVALKIGLSSEEAENLAGRSIDEGMKSPLYSEPNAPGNLIDFRSPTTINLTGVPPVSASVKCPPLERKFIESCLHQGEKGDALMLAQLFKGRIAFDKDRNKWYIWAGNHWAEDKLSTLPNLIEHIVNQYSYLATAIHNEILRDTKPDGEIVETEESKAASARQQGHLKLYNKLMKRILALHDLRRVKNVEGFAKILTGIPILSDVWGANPMLLGVKNGVIELETGTFRPGKPDDYILLDTIAPVEWQGFSASCPRFEKYLDEVFQDPEIIAFMQRLLGYAITGLTREDKYFIWWGEDGRNGKDTLVTAMIAALGDTLAGIVSNDIFIDTKGRSAGQATPHLTDLHGIRFACSSELREGERFHEAQIKWLTGGNPITARPLYGDYITFKPTHKLFLLTNHKAHASDDAAFWSRLLIIPFTQRFVENPTKPNEHPVDKTLRDTIGKESAGILAWLVQGCLKWQAEGLNPPVSIVKATEEYRNEENTLQHFIDECCEASPNAKTQATGMYNAYRVWAANNGIPPMSQTAFGKRIVKIYKRTEANGMRFYEKVQLRPGVSSVIDLF